MELPVHGLKPLLIDMRVYLRRGNVGVAQHLLDDPQIRAVSEQMRCETVPEKVRIHVLFQSGALRVFLHDLPYPRCG